MASRERKRTRQLPATSVNQPKMGTGVSHFVPGDLVQVHMLWLFPENPRHSLPIWIRVERCDHQRRIVYGTIESGPPGIDKALTSGARLAVSYDLVR